MQDGCFFPPFQQGCDIKRSTVKDFKGIFRPSLGSRRDQPPRDQVIIAVIHGLPLGSARQFWSLALQAKIIKTFVRSSDRKLQLNNYYVQGRRGKPHDFHPQVPSCVPGDAMVLIWFGFAVWHLATFFHSSDVQNALTSVVGGWICSLFRGIYFRC